LPKEKKIVFPPFWLDPANEQLWMGLESVPLNRKAYAVLHFLAQRPDPLVFESTGRLRSRFSNGAEPRP
jgi:DNA-binding winged helix-turn-helix (wHTH) protein